MEILFFRINSIFFNAITVIEQPSNDFYSKFYFVNLENSIELLPEASKAM